MVCFKRHFPAVLGLMMVLSSSATSAQDSPFSFFDSTEKTPAPAATEQNRITPPVQPAEERGMLTTHDAAATAEPKSAEALPWQSEAAPKAPAENPSTPGEPLKVPFGKVPFGHAEPTGPVVPSAPHTAEAVPVGSVESIEAKEAEPPTPVVPEEDPTQVDPAQPTDLTSPIFAEDKTPQTTRKMVIRAVNKVTAQSALLELKPGEHTKFGQIDIHAMACRVSEPQSQYDAAGLMEISEQVRNTESKLLFRGWMYASSPSITSLEHPIYDVTMVDCKMAGSVAKKDTKLTAGKAEKSAKKAKE